ncbi:SRPBCC family protein [Halococcus dombrowskii]|uniref:SRPBCC family protein n=1 Tax=Halococcus dombrowskii TaxID=179637 RepID=A0AAV3SIG0_HALDO|nr:SRPBCC family protein [Halococcus dombrowskii]UOO93846.1 SRPBCC family protein [Halococcus dombrowskii]
MNTAIERTPDGRRLLVSRPIDAPADIVWSILTDTDRWPEWGPSIAAVDCPDRFIHEGSHGHVETVGPGALLPSLSNSGLRVPFRVTSCADRRWTWRVAGVPATGHRVEPVGENCRTAFEIPLPAAAYAPVCRRALIEIERLAGDATG